jgi:hypothetical protein
MSENQIDANMEAIALAPAPAPASASQKVCQTQLYSRFAPIHAYHQAAAAARIVGKPDVFEAAESGDLELVKDHFLADAGCVHNANDK